MCHDLRKMPQPLCKNSYRRLLETRLRTSSDGSREGVIVLEKLMMG